MPGQCCFVNDCAAASCCQDCHWLTLLLFGLCPQAIVPWLPLSTYSVCSFTESEFVLCRQWWRLESGFHLRLWSCRSTGDAFILRAQAGKEVIGSRSFACPCLLLSACSVLFLAVVQSPVLPSSSLSCHSGHQESMSGSAVGTL